jgi:hypothetical protein
LVAIAAAGNGVVERVGAADPDAHQVVDALERAGAAVIAGITVASNGLLGGEVLDDWPVANVRQRRMWSHSRS